MTTGAADTDSHITVSPRLIWEVPGPKSRHEAAWVIEPIRTITGTGNGFALNMTIQGRCTPIYCGNPEIAFYSTFPAPESTVAGLSFPFHHQTTITHPPLSLLVDAYSRGHRQARRPRPRRHRHQQRPTTTYDLTHDRTLTPRNMATTQTEPPAPAAAGTSSSTSNAAPAAATGLSGPHTTSPPLIVPRPPSPLGATRPTNEQLAGLLANAYSEVAQLKQELAQATRRAEVAERVAKSLGPASSSSANGTGSGVSGTSGGASGSGSAGGGGSSTSELIQRITNLELQLDVAQGQLHAERDRRGHLYNHWCSVEEYLIGLERTAQETRRTFTGALQAEALGTSPVSPVGECFAFFFCGLGGNVRDTDWLSFCCGYRL